MTSKPLEKRHDIQWPTKGAASQANAITIDYTGPQKGLRLLLTFCWDALTQRSISRRKPRRQRSPPGGKGGGVWTSSSVPKHRARGPEEPTAAYVSGVSSFRTRPGRLPGILPSEFSNLFLKVTQPPIRPPLKRLTSGLNDPRPTPDNPSNPSLRERNGLLLRTKNYGLRASYCRLLRAGRGGR